MFQFIPVNDEKNIAIRVSGKLTREDYQHFIPQLESVLVENEKITFSLINSLPYLMVFLLAQMT